MIIKRKESWGELQYDTKTHKFTVKPLRTVDEQPYVSFPILLNVDITFKCNMECWHCVAKDMAKELGGVEKADLRISNEFLAKINRSPFIVVVITGGEPLLKDYEESLTRLINGLENKGIIVDTNGTIFPSHSLLRLFQKRDVMVRVSWDIAHPREEFDLRKYPEGMYPSHDKYIQAKEHLIKRLVNNGLKVGIQSVIHGRNWNSINFHNFPYKIKELKIDRWYLQRFIPSHQRKNDPRYILDIDNYENTIRKIKIKTNTLGINIFTKMDRRHNSVFLLVKDGELFTQSDNRPGEKIFLGKIGETNNYFDYVSSSEHSLRYYAIR